MLKKITDLRGELQGAKNRKYELNCSFIFNYCLLDYLRFVPRILQEDTVL